MKLRRIAWALMMLAGGARAEGFEWRGEVLLSEQLARAASDSPFRRLAEPPDHRLELEWWPDLDWRGESVSVALRPRALSSSVPGETRTDAWINEGWLRWRPLAGLSLQLGREVLLWGPGAFWNPSNPFFPRNNKDNPKREIGGHDIARARWQMNPSWALSWIAQQDGGHGAQDDDLRRDALKLDWIGAEASAAALVSARPGKAPGWFGWVQWTASDALLVYGEAAWSGDDAVVIARQAPSPTGWHVESRSVKRGPRMLLGASWTFESNWTLSGELWRYGGGLDAADAHAVADAAAGLSRQPRGLADAQLASLLGQAEPMRRNYAGLQLINGGEARTAWTLRYKRSLDDQGGEAFVMVRRDLGDALQVWANAMVRHGGPASEYGRWIDRSVMLGMSWFH